MKKLVLWIPLLVIITLALVGCANSYILSVSGKVTQISEYNDYFVLYFSGSINPTSFNWNYEKPIPFDLDKYYRIKYRTGGKIWDKANILEYSELESK